MEFWGDPEPVGDAAREHIDIEMLPTVFGQMVGAVSDSLCVSIDMVAGAGLGVASVAANKHWIELKPGWMQPLSLYVVGCAQAGERKSPVLKALRSPLDSWAEHRNMDLKPQIAESKQRLRNLRAELAAAEKALEKGTGDEAETLRLARAVDDFEEVRPVRLYAGDVTPEKLAALLQDNGERLSILSDEGGVFSMISGSRYSSGVANTDIFCQAFNGEPVSVDRVTSGSVSLREPVLSMVLFCQPVILSGLLDNETLRGVGLVDRCLLFEPTSSVGAETFDAPPIPPQIETAYSNMLQRILDEPRRRTLRLSDRARTIYRDWFNQFTRDIPFVYSDMPGWASKHRGTVGRIAGILQLMEGAADYVTEDNMFRAIVLSDYFAEQARRLYRRGAVNRVERDADHILKSIETLQGRAQANEDGRLFIRYSDLQRQAKRGRRFSKKVDYMEPLQALIDKGWIDVPEDVDIEHVNVIYVNPRLWEKGD